MPKLKNPKILGMIATCASALLFSCGYALGSLIEASGMSKTCNSLWTSLIAVILNLGASMVRRENPFRGITRKQLGLCALCGVSATWLCNFMFLVSYQYLTVQEATMLHFLHPAMIAVFMTAVFHERFSLSKLGAIVCSIVSMIFIAGGIPSGSAVGILAAISTGIFYGVYPVTLEITSLKEVPGRMVVLYMNIAGGLCALVVSLASGTFSLPISPQVWGLDVILALTTFFAYVLSCYGVRVLGATNASFGSMLEPVASCVIAAVWLGESISLNVLWGGILVLLSMVLCSVNSHGKTRQRAVGTRHLRGW